MSTKCGWDIVSGGTSTHVKTRPFSHVTIMLWLNVPTLSNVIELWSEMGQPPSTPDRVANSVKVPLRWPGRKDRLGLV